MKDKQKIPQQRNPYLVFALLRAGAGSHRKSNKAQRQQAKQALRKETNNKDNPFNILTQTFQLAY